MLDLERIFDPDRDDRPHHKGDPNWQKKPYDAKEFLESLQKPWEVERVFAVGRQDMPGWVWIDCWHVKKGNWHERASWKFYEQLREIGYFGRPFTPPPRP